MLRNTILNTIAFGSVFFFFPSGCCQLIQPTHVNYWLENKRQKKTFFVLQCTVELAAVLALNSMLLMPLSLWHNIKPHQNIRTLFNIRNAVHIMFKHMKSSKRKIQHKKKTIPAKYDCKYWLCLSVHWCCLLFNM